MHASARVPSSGAYNSVTASSYERLRPHDQGLGRTGWGGIKHIRRLQREALAISDLVDVKSLVYELILSIGHVRECAIVGVRLPSCSHLWMHSLSVQLTRAPLLKCFGALPAFLDVKSQQLEGTLLVV